MVLSFVSNFIFLIFLAFFKYLVSGQRQIFITTFDVDKNIWKLKKGFPTEAYSRSTKTEAACLHRENMKQECHKSKIKSL